MTQIYVTGLQSWKREDAQLRRIPLHAEVDKVGDPGLAIAIQGKRRVYIASPSIQTGRDKVT
jgi:hypothetical protein